MLEKDYLTRMFVVLAAAIRKSLFERVHDPRAAADTLEEAISTSTDIDGTILLSLSPESMTQVLKVSGVDSEVCGYIAHSLALEADYLDDANDDHLASTRRAQAAALAREYGIDLSTTKDDLDQFVTTYGTSDD